jgi:hypothetical protein
VIKAQDIGRKRENEDMLCGIYPVKRGQVSIFNKCPAPRLKSPVQEY